MFTTLVIDDVMVTIVNHENATTYNIVKKDDGTYTETVQRNNKIVGKIVNRYFPVKTSSPICYLHSL